MKFVYVMIDDQLPCYAGNLETPQLIYAKCQEKSEFWVPLIEKGFAKLHGCYQSLIGG